MNIKQDRQPRNEKFDQSKAEYDCADLDMDGNSSICIDEVILKTNTARV